MTAYGPGYAMMLHPLCVICCFVIGCCRLFRLVFTLVANSIKNQVLKQIFIYSNFHDFYIKWVAKLLDEVPMYF